MKINEVIKQSIELDESMPKKLDNPDGLSHAIATQGMYRSFLGAKLATLEKECADMKNALAYQEALMKKRLLGGSKIAVNRAELEIDIDEEINELRSNLVDKQYQVRLLVLKRDDIKTAMDGYRSRLAFIREETK